MSWRLDRDKGREVGRGNVMVVLPTVGEEVTPPWLAIFLPGQNHCWAEAAVLQKIFPLHPLFLSSLPFCPQEPLVSKVRGYSCCSWWGWGGRYTVGSCCSTALPRMPFIQCLRWGERAGVLPVYGENNWFSERRVTWNSLLITQILFAPSFLLIIKIYLYWKRTTDPYGCLACPDELCCFNIAYSTSRKLAVVRNNFTTEMLLSGTILRI